MEDQITISYTRENNDDITSKKRLTQLKKLKVADINNIISEYNIKLRNINSGVKANKDVLINSIILHEKMLLFGRQTEITYNNKSYWIQTKNNLISIKKETSIANDIYNVSVNLCSDIPNMEVLFDKIKKQLTFKGNKNNLEIYLSILNDVKLCRKALVFMESLDFCFKIYLYMSIYDENGINDIKRNICLVYLEKTLRGCKNIRCKLV